MKHTRITAIILVLVMAAAALLTLGCGKEEEKLEIEGMWHGELIALDEKFSAGRYIAYADGKVHLYGTVTEQQGEEQIYTPAMMIYDGETAEYQKLEELSSNVQGFVKISYGYVFYMSEFNFETREEKKYMTAYADGLQTWTLMLDEIFDMSNNRYGSIYYTARGNEIVLAYDKQLALVGSDGKLKKQLDLDVSTRNLFSNNAGEVFVVGINGSTSTSEVYQLTNDNILVQISNDSYTSLSGNSIVTSGIGELCYSNESGIFVTYSDVGAKPLLNFVSTGISLSLNTISVCVADEDAIYLYGSDGIGGERGFWRYTPVPADEIPERKIIRIAYTENGTKKVPMAAVKFNKAQSEYYIMPVEYSSIEGDYDASMARLDADIISGKAGDIIFMRGYDDYTRYATNGAFADLSEYIDTSDIFGCVVDLCTIDGKLYALPQSFNVVSMLVKKGDSIADGGFTMSDFIDGYKSGRRIYCDMSRDNIMGGLLECAVRSSIDFEKNTCDFSGMKELLDFYNELPEVDSGAISQYDGNHYATGEIAMYDYKISDFLSWAHKDYIFDGEGELLGVPTMDGEKRFFVDTYSGYLGVMKSSKYKDGAAQFVKYLLSSDVVYDEMRGLRDIPTSKAAFEYAAEHNDTQYAFFYKEDLTRTSGGSRPFEDRDDGWSVEIGETVFNGLREFLDSVKVAKPLPEKLVNIVAEELEGFMNGTKSADEVIKLLNGRISTYLAERE